MAPSIPSSSTHYALVVDAGSSGSRLQIYSWRDPGLERTEILDEVRAARKAGLGTGEIKSRWWWWDSLKGKGRATAKEMEKRALRRLVRVGRGVEGDGWVKRIEPGISEIAPEDIPAYFAPLMAHAMEHIPPSQQANTPIYVLATAGMRRLSLDAQNKIIEETCSTLRRDYPFAIGHGSSAGPCGENVRIISGEEEGIWGWVAVNYLMDGFGHAPDLAHGEDEEGHDHLLPLAPLADAPDDSHTMDSVTPVDVHHHSPTFGFLDMGGASTQLAFSPSQEELASSKFPTSDLLSVSLRLLSGEEVEWPVFAASWLGFGTNVARERYEAVVVKEWLEENDLPEADAKIADACLPAGLVVPSPDKSKHPDFVGSGNFTSCLNSLTPLLTSDKPCPTHHCLFGGMPTPQIDFHKQDQRGFIGISEYWYTAQQVLGLGGVWDWAEWERGMGDFCAQDWAGIEAKVKEENGWRGADVELSRLKMQCFKGAWISNVLHEGIGIPRLVDAGGNDTLTTGSTNDEAEARARAKGLFQSMDEVGKTAISWTLGKVVIEASRSVARTAPAGIDWRAHATKVPPLVLLAYAVLASVVLYFFFTLLKRRRCLIRSRRRGNGGYTTLSSYFNSSSADEEEGDSYFPPAKRRPTKFKLWSRRVTNALKRNVSLGQIRLERPRGKRHASMPLSTPPQGTSQSQPSSPRSGGRSFSMMDLPGAIPRTPPLGSSSSVSSTPRPPRPRQNSGNGLLDPHYPGLSRDQGWNDPPMSMLARSRVSTEGSGGYESSSADDDWAPKKRSGVLTPAVGLSRNSSRANLSELGLAQRTASRVATPQ